MEYDIIDCGTPLFVEDQSSVLLLEASRTILPPYKRILIVV